MIIVIVSSGVHNGIVVALCIYCIIMAVDFDLVLVVCTSVVTLSALMVLRAYVVPSPCTVFQDGLFCNGE